MAKKRKDVDRRARVPTHIRAADRTKIDKLRKHIERETGIIDLPEPDVISRALQIAIEHYEGNK